MIWRLICSVCFAKWLIMVFLWDEMQWEELDDELQREERVKWGEEKGNQFCFCLLVLLQGCTDIGIVGIYPSHIFDLPVLCMIWNLPESALKASLFYTYLFVSISYLLILIQFRYRHASLFNLPFSCLAQDRGSSTVSTPSTAVHSLSSESIQFKLKSYFQYCDDSPVR